MVCLPAPAFYTVLLAALAGGPAAQRLLAQLLPVGEGS